MKMFENKYLDVNAPITMKAAQFAESRYGATCYCIHANAGIEPKNDMIAVAEIITEYNLDREIYHDPHYQASRIYELKYAPQKMQHVTDEILEISKQYPDNIPEFINVATRITQTRSYKFNGSVVPFYLTKANVLIIVYDNTVGTASTSDLDCAERIQSMLINSNKANNCDVPFSSLSDLERIAQLARRLIYRISWVGSVAYQKIVQMVLKDPELIDKIESNFECNFAPNVIVVDKHNAELYQILNTLVDDDKFRNQNEYHNSANESDEFVDIINFLISDDEICCTEIAVYSANDDPDEVDSRIFDAIIIDANIADEKLHEFCTIYANDGSALNRVVSGDQYGPDSHITSFDMFKTVLARVKGEQK